MLKCCLERHAHNLTESRKFLYRNKIIDCVNTNAKPEYPNIGSSQLILKLEGHG